MSKLTCFSKWVLFNLALFLNFNLYLSLPENHFGDCLPKKCGNININFPFRIIEQQKSYCGFPGFDVICKNNKLVYFNISGSSYVIKNISYEKQTFQVVSSVIHDKQSCFGAIHHLNLTLNNAFFNYAANYSEILLLLNCPQKLLSEKRLQNSEICGAIAVYEDEAKIEDLEGKCNGFVSVAYEGWSENVSSIREKLEQGFSLKWTGKNCSACIETGGQCGYDQSVSDYGCYCPDRTHSYHCVPDPVLPTKNSYYDACIPRMCGNLSITYPFYINGLQKPYCGYPDFGVLCDQKYRTIINISGDSYIIRKISYDDQLAQVINSAFIDSGSNCIPPLHNITFGDSTFKLASNHSNLFLLENCTKAAIAGLQVYKETPCTAENDTRKVYFTFGKDIHLETLASSCASIVSVPYEGQSSSDVENVVSRGILLNWAAGNCSACRTSGGRCGLDEVTSEPKCFCRDRPHIYSCRYYPSPNSLPDSRTRQPLQLILGSVIGVIILMFGAAVFAICWYRKKHSSPHSKFVSETASLERSGSDVEKGSVYFGVPLFTYSELKEATDSFDQSRELGDGGFGTVYYGKLRDGREVAVKRLYEKNYRRVEQFMNEVQILTCLRHQNLVSLYGCTSCNSKELLLVYEFVPNGTVADHLYGEKANNGPLPWSSRLKIAIETASALGYLHASDIVHRDVKTHNILLDSNCSVKVADFGLSRLFPSHVSHISTAPQGTPGYLDPEYNQCYQLTDKSDVYSFGVVLVELISSLPAVDMSRHRHEINLSNYAMTRIQRCAFDELVDPALGYHSDFKVKRMTTAVGELAFQCLQHDKEFRPSMEEILVVLRSIENMNYEDLETEELARSGSAVQGTKPPLSPVEDDHAKLLSAQPPHPSSPISVMHDWASKSTTPSSSK